MELCQSGLMSIFAKDVSPLKAPRVRIPPAPQRFLRTAFAVRKKRRGEGEKGGGHEGGRAGVAGFFSRKIPVTESLRLRQ